METGMKLMKKLEKRNRRGKKNKAAFFLKAALTVVACVVLVAGAVIAMNIRMANEDIEEEVAYEEVSVIQDETDGEELLYSSTNIEAGMLDENSEEDEQSKYRVCVPYDGIAREISCWGDSMTYGVGASPAYIRVGNKFMNISYATYPDTLSELTGITTHNFGIPGATSEEIAIMQGGLEAKDPLEDYPAIDYDIMSEAEGRTGDILILEIGSNGGWDNDYNTLIAQYNAMIDYSGCDYFIIIGDTDDPGTSIGDLNQTEYNEDGSYVGLQDTMWEAALREAYGDHFINMRTYLIQNGLNETGLRASEEDEELMNAGCISTQLRSDWTHFNSYGYYVKGIAVYEKGVQLGYWE